MGEKSPTYRRWVGETLTAEGGEQLFVPRGFAHAFCTLEPDTVVAYKVDEFYAPESESGLIWKNARSLPNVPSPLVYRGVLYTLKEGGILTSFDTRTGAIVKQGRLQGGKGDDDVSGLERIRRRGVVLQFHRADDSARGQGYLRANQLIAVCQRLEHDPEKWVPVFRKDHAQNKKIERDEDSKKLIAL